MKYLIKNGRIVSSEGQKQADILIVGGRIAAIGEGLEEAGAAEIDAAGKYIFPGFIDTHTHFDLDAGDFHTADDFYTGTRAALAGGTTTILDFTTQERGQTLKEALDVWHRMAEGKSSCHYGFHMSITDWNEEVRKEIPEMTRLGVTSYKLYMAYDNLKVSDEEIEEILAAIEAEKGIVGVHCENGAMIEELTRKLKAEYPDSVSLHPKSRPPEAEAEAVERLARLAAKAHAAVTVVHLSSRAGLEAVRQARAAGGTVFAETCPQYLVLEDSVYEKPGFEGAAYVCSPPIRTAADREALWEAVRAGEIDIVGTDHCSFHMGSQKVRGREDFTRIPNGLPGVEHRPVLLYHFGVAAGRIGPEMMCRLLSERPAKLFGMYPQKGAVLVGSDADLVIWDPEAEWTITAKDQVQNVDYTPYEGMRVTGSPETVFLGGVPAARRGKVIRELRGCYVHRGPRQL